MAVADAVEAQRDRPGGDGVALGAVEGAGAPGRRPPRLVVLGRPAVEGGDRLALGVAGDPVERLGASAQLAERLGDERPAEDVAENDDRVRLLAVELGENRPQRRRVPVDVGKDGGPDRRSLVRHHELAAGTAARRRRVRNLADGALAPL